MDKIIDLQAGRRAFLTSVGLGLGTLAVGQVIGATPAAADHLSDADILNFALNLEYLEAEFYLRAAFGRGLDADETTGAGARGSVNGGRRVDFRTRAIYEYAAEIAGDELNHVRFLRSGLGSARVARPRIDFTNAFTAAARAAGLIGSSQRFDAFANEDNFLLAAFIFEDVGVTAYKGAARALTNKDFLEAAAGILAVEAYHAGTVRTLLFQKGFLVEAQKISDLRDAVDGGSSLDQGLTRRAATSQAPTVANLVPGDGRGIAYSRSPEQVLSIVYLGNRDKGGFFPAGLNGTVR